MRWLLGLLVVVGVLTGSLVLFGKVTDAARDRSLASTSARVLAPIWSVEGRSRIFPALSSGVVRAALRRAPATACVAAPDLNRPATVRGKLFYSSGCSRILQGQTLEEIEAAAHAGLMPACPHRPYFATTSVGHREYRMYVISLWKDFPLSYRPLTCVSPDLVVINEVPTYWLWHA